MKIGTKPIERKRLTADALKLSILDALGSQELNQTAENLGKSIREQNGVQEAVALLEEIIQ